MAAAGKIEQGEKPVKQSDAIKNEQSYNLLGQMMGGVSGAPGMKKPKGRKRV